MKKGFVLTIVFTLLALLVVQQTLFLLSLSRPQFGPDDSYVRDDLGRDSLVLLGVDYNISKASGQTTIEVKDFLPSKLTSPITTAADFQSFVEGPYSLRSGRNVTFASPFPSSLSFQPYLSYGYPSLSKPSLTASGPFTGISIVGSLSANCATSCGNDTSYSWTWDSSGIPVSLNIKDGAGSPILLNGSSSGMVDPTLPHSFTTTLSGGSFTFSIVSVSGTPALDIAASGTKASLNQSFTFAGQPPVRAVLPLGLAIDGANYSSMILEEK